MTTHTTSREEYFIKTQSMPELLLGRNLMENVAPFTIFFLKYDYLGIR